MHAVYHEHFYQAGSIYPVGGSKSIVNSLLSTVI